MVSSCVARSAGGRDRGARWIVDSARPFVLRKPGGPCSSPGRLSAASRDHRLVAVPCLLGCLALSTPRLVLVLVWLLSEYLQAVYRTWLWPLLGFVFLPLTTLAYAFAMHFGGGEWTPIGLGAVVTAVLVDLGLFRTGTRRRGKDGGGASPSREIVVEGEKVG